MIANLIEEYFQTFLNTKGYSSAARAIVMLSEDGNQQTVLELGLRLLEELKEYKSVSILVGERPYLSDQTKTQAFLRFFADFLHNQFKDKKINQTTYVATLLDISLLSGFSSITQTIFQQNATNTIQSADFNNALTEIRSIRSKLEQARENIISIAPKETKSLLAKLSKSKKVVRDNLSNIGSSDLYPSEILEQIQKSLRQKEIIVIFIDGDETRYSLQITNDKVVINTSRRADYPDWRRLKRELSISKQTDKLQKELIDLSNLLVPADSMIDFEIITFIPSPELFGFPFKALTLPGTENLDVSELVLNQRFLIQNYVISSNFSVLGQLDLQQNNQREMQTQRGMLAFANPDFNTMDASVTESLLTIFRSARNTISVVENLPPLPESEDEAKAIAEFFPESKIYSGASATLNNLLSTNVNNYSHIIFATHALKPNEIKGVMTSALVLTPTDGELGLLTPSIIRDLPLSAQFVSLSACSTSAPELGNGEIYSGLVRSFIEAGAKAVFFTEWQVETNTAAYIHTHLQKYLSLGEETDVALSKAIRDFLTSEGNNHLHPYFWAQFSLALR